MQASGIKIFGNIVFPRSLHSSMDRISDSGSDDYGSTPYGDTSTNPQNIVFQYFEDFYFNFIGILRLPPSPAFNTITFIKKRFFNFVVNYTLLGSHYIEKKKRYAQSFK